MRRWRTPTARLTLRLMRADLFEGCAWRRRDQLEFFSCFRQSCLASAVPWAGRNRPLALGLCAPMVPRDGPPSPGLRRWPPATRHEAHSFRSPRRSRIRDVDLLNRPRRRSRCVRQRTRAQGYEPGAATWGLLRAGAGVYGPAGIAAPSLSGASPSRGEAELVSLDRAAA